MYVYSRSGSTWAENVNKWASSAGAAYVFSCSGSVWNETNLMKAKNPASNDEFGFSVSLSDDASIMAIGALGENSSFTGISNDGTGEGDNLNSRAGAVYIY